MPTKTDNPIAEVKAGLLGQWAPGGKPIGDLKAVLDYDPLKFPKLPALTIMFRGFRRAALETPNVQAPIRDPLMGRRWVWLFWVRVYVAVKSDAQKAQDDLDALVPQVVKAFEEDRTLGGVSVDAALATGEARIVRPKEGQPTLMLTCDCAVETEEPLN